MCRYLQKRFYEDYPPVSAPDHDTNVTVVVAPVRGSVQVHDTFNYETDTVLLC